MRIIVTGAAGFIGFHCVQKFVALGHEVLGVDNINSYYDVRLKHARLRETGIENVQEETLTQSTKYPNYSFIKGDLSNAAFVKKLFNPSSLVPRHLSLVTLHFPPSSSTSPPKPACGTASKTPMPISNPTSSAFTISSKHAGRILSITLFTPLLPAFMAILLRCLSRNRT